MQSLVDAWANYKLMLRSTSLDYRSFDRSLLLVSVEDLSHEDVGEPDPTGFGSCAGTPAQ